MNKILCLKVSKCLARQIELFCSPSSLCPLAAKRYNSRKLATRSKVVAWLSCKFNQAFDIWPKYLTWCQFNHSVFAFAGMFVMVAGRLKQLLAVYKVPLRRNWTRNKSAVVKWLERLIVEPEGLGSIPALSECLISGVEDISHGRCRDKEIVLLKTKQIIQLRLRLANPCEDSA